SPLRQPTQPRSLASYSFTLDGGWAHRDFLSEPPKCDRRQSRSCAPQRYSRQERKTGTSVMLSFARVLDRVRPQASLAIALVLSVAWIDAFDYGLLRRVWSQCRPTACAGLGYAKRAAAKAAA